MQVTPHSTGAPRVGFRNKCEIPEIAATTNAEKAPTGVPEVFSGVFPGSFLVEANPLDDLIELTVIQMGAVRVDRGSDVPLVRF